MGDTQTKQAGKRKTTASARVTETAVSSPSMYVVGNSSIAQAAPLNGNAVAQLMLDRKVVLVGETTELTPPSAKTTSKVFCVHPAPVTINRKRLEASNPLRAKVDSFKRYRDGRPLTPWKPPGTVAHRNSPRHQPSRREEYRSKVPLEVPKGRGATQTVRGGESCRIPNHRNRVSSKLVSTES